MLEKMIKESFSCMELRGLFHKHRTSFIEDDDLRNIFIDRINYLRIVWANNNAVNSKMLDDLVEDFVNYLSEPIERRNLKRLSVKDDAVALEVLKTKNKSDLDRELSPLTYIKKHDGILISLKNWEECDIAAKVEEEMIRQVLIYTSFNKTRASEILNMNPRTLRYKLKQYKDDYISKRKKGKLNEKNRLRDYLQR